MKKREEANASCHVGGTTPRKKKNSNKGRAGEEKDDGEFQISHPILLSRTNRLFKNTDFPPPNGQRTPTFAADLDFLYSEGPSTHTTSQTISLSKAGSHRCSTPIFFSHSIATVRKKPPPVEKKLECTLEELCHGCVKKIKITRDAMSSSGLIVQEEEILSIQIKPGWKKGTTFTFEGKGDEGPGTLPADILFSIEEKRHPLFKREGNDLELGIVVPLVEALTGCTVPIPLLGGEQLQVSVDDIIYPGFEMIVPGQGMPISKLQGKRGDLKLKFMVTFPTELNEDQRKEVVSILESCSS